MPCNDGLIGLETRELAATANAEAAEAGSISLRVIVKTLRREYRRFLLVALVTFLLVSGIAVLLPASYTATASFIPPTSGNGGLSSLASQLGAVGAGAVLGAVKNNGDLYIGMLGSHTVASRLVARFQLMSVYRTGKESKAIRKLAQHSHLEVGVRDGIVTVTVTEGSAERARDLANAYLEELRNVTSQLAISEAAQRRLFFEQQLVRQKDKLADAEVAMKQVQEKTGLIVPAGQAQVGLTTIAQTRSSIATREVQLAGLRYSATEQNPEVIERRQELAALKAQLAVLEVGNGSAGMDDVPLAKVPQVELEFIRQERDVKYQEGLFQMIAKQYEAARLDESHEASQMQILDRATLPDERSGPQRWVIAALGLVLGLVLGGLTVLLNDRSWISHAGV